MQFVHHAKENAQNSKGGVFSHLLRNRVTDSVKALALVATIAATPTVLQYPHAKTVVSMDYSTNWSGYISSLRNENVVRISGKFIMPIVNDGCDAKQLTGSGAQDPSLAIWVGIEGAGISEPSLIQVGAVAIDNVVSKGGHVPGKRYSQVRYFGFYEMLPDRMVRIPMGIEHGDRLRASITNVGKGAFRLKLQNLSRKERAFTKTVNYEHDALYPTPRTSGEWIVERPSKKLSGMYDSDAFYPMAGFGKVSFADARIGYESTVNGAAPKNKTIGQSNSTLIYMYGERGKNNAAKSIKNEEMRGYNLAIPSPISGGTRFDVVDQNCSPMR